MVLTGKVANLVRGAKAQRLALFRAAVGFDWTIITYEQVRELRDVLPEIAFALLACDEAQYLKNPRAQRTVAVLGELRRLTAEERQARGDRKQWLWAGGVQAPRHLMLSGTPMLSRPIELYPLLHSVNPEEWSNEFEYKDKYCGAQTFGVNDTRYHYGEPNDEWRLRGDQEWPKREITTFNGASNVEELHRRIKGSYHRIKLADALPDLPELTKVDAKVTLNDGARAEYDLLLDDFPKWLAAQGKGEEEIARTMRAAALAKIGHLRQCKIADKVEHISEALDTILEGWGIDAPDGAKKRVAPRAVPAALSAEDAEGRESVLVFCTFKEPLLELKRRYGPLCGMITGAESAPQREEAKRAFQAGEMPILLLTHGAGGVGLNLQRARIVFLLNEEWTPSANEQAIGRAHRNGQKNGVTAYTLLADETVDAAIHEALALKAEVIAQVMDGESADDVRVTSVLAHVLRKLGAEARKRFPEHTTCRTHTERRIRPALDGGGAAMTDGRARTCRAGIATDPLPRDLYNKGLTDGEIADILGVTPMEVILFRQTYGLEANKRPPSTHAGRKGNDLRFRAFYDEGLHDAGIARRMGVSRAAVGLWRGRQNPPLKPNKPFASSEECREYYVRGMTDEEIHSETGLALNTIRHWRFRYQLPAVTKSYRDVDEHGNAVVRSGVPDYMKYYLLGWNDAEIASAVNRTQSAVYTWRRDRGLPRNVRGRPKPGTEAVHVPIADRTPRGIILMHIGRGREGRGRE